MNETIKTLTTRRIVRSYSNKPVEKELLDEILEAGMYAPSGKGLQSPLMVVVTDPERVYDLSMMNAAVLGTDTDPFYGAGTVIIVFADSTVRTYIEDGSLVMGNLMNAAHSLGVDSCWIHRAREVFETPEGKALMKKWGIDEKYKGIGNCILGYADKPVPEAKPRKGDYVIFGE
ncbi:MAG: nitroreductase [Oscillospiraceae bacterium]|nr:nitroreductase [Oscillospiraceae bacterium]